jgi:hypothetical protein
LAKFVVNALLSSSQTSNETSVCRSVKYLLGSTIVLLARSRPNPLSAPCVQLDTTCKTVNAWLARTNTLTAQTASWENARNASLDTTTRQPTLIATIVHRNTPSAINAITRNARNAMRDQSCWKAFASPAPPLFPTARLALSTNSSKVAYSARTVSSRTHPNSSSVSDATSSTLTVACALQTPVPFALQGSIQTLQGTVVSHVKHPVQRAVQLHASLARRTNFC